LIPSIAAAATIHASSGTAAKRLASTSRGISANKATAAKAASG
jgi:hypothetical protein